MTRPLPNKGDFVIVTQEAAERLRNYYELGEDVVAPGMLGFVTLVNDHGAAYVVLLDSPCPYAGRLFKHPWLVRRDMLIPVDPDFSLNTPRDILRTIALLHRICMVWKEPRYINLLNRTYEVARRIRGGYNDENSVQ